ncbi:hypothetical protein KSP40_PGU012201 [Platanthera guangdongensis]|uniref:Uncharacterized protein n=1 Tax=Platanthera guangdongensis TaxID=2320717 RepID=A0ABR2M4X2_9ASPA
MDSESYGLYGEMKSREFPADPELEKLFKWIFFQIARTIGAEVLRNISLENMKEIESPVLRKLDQLILNKFQGGLSRTVNKGSVCGNLFSPVKRLRLHEGPVHAVMTALTGENKSPPNEAKVSLHHYAGQ